MQQKGFTLWEVLIALSLFSLGLMMISHIQLNNIHFIEATYLQNKAINEIQEIAWCVMHHESFDKLSHLPKESRVMNEKKIELTWQSPVPQWHCQGSPHEHESCLEYQYSSLAVILAKRGSRVFI